MAYKQIEYETNGRIAIVRTNRPKYRNAQSRLLIEEMDDAFIKAERDPNIHVVILQGAGDHFSAGHDLGTPEQQADLKARPYTEGTLGHMQMTWDLFVDASLRWRDLRNTAPFHRMKCRPLPHYRKDFRFQSRGLHPASCSELLSRSGRRSLRTKLRDRARRGQ